jgi:DNA end-binding protein Ku
MAPCSTWKGSLKFSSTACRVSMTPATSGNETVYFYPFDRMARQPAVPGVDCIDIEAFVAKGAIDWTWYDKAHYMVPDDSAGDDAFSVVRDALETTGTVAIAHLVLYGCERALMLEPRDMGIVLWTLRRRHDALALQHAGAVELPAADPVLTARVVAEIERLSHPLPPRQNEASRPAGARGAASHAARAEWSGNVIDLTDARRRQAMP